MWTPTSVTFGLRHENVFGFLGRAGDILDAVRKAEGNRIIPNKLFTKVNWPNQITARLLSDDESVTADFSIEGIILTADLEEIEWSRERVKTLFVELARIALPISYGEESVNRIGIIDNYTIEQELPSEVAVSTLTSLRSLGQPSDFNLRVAFRTPTTNALVRGDLEDWRNTILQVVARKKSDKSERLDTLRVSIDHQAYFIPSRRFSPSLIHDHYDRFLAHIENLQAGPLAGLVPQDREAHGR